MLHLDLPACQIPVAVRPPLLCTALMLLLLTGCVNGIDRDAAASQNGSLPTNTDGLRLLDASFATEIRNRQPSRVSQAISGDDPQLSFWMEFVCTGICEQRLPEDEQVIVSLEWYKEEDGHLLKQAVHR